MNRLKKGKIKPIISEKPKSRENLYLHNGKIYQYVGLEEQIVQILTNEFVELQDQSLSNILNIMAHITEDEEEYKVLCELSDKAYHLEDRIKKLNEELDEYKSYF